MIILALTAVALFVVLYGPAWDGEPDPRPVPVRNDIANQGHHE